MAVKRIRELYPLADFDPKPFLHPQEEEYDAKLTKQYRLGYSCFKYAVASVLKPKKICEIGVYSGGSAMAFMEGSPEAHYVGIDNNFNSHKLGVDFTAYVKAMFDTRGGDYAIIEADSMKLDYIPEYDLLHVDGNHSYAFCKHDVYLGLRSKTEWILVDDALDSQVAAATFDALFEHCPGTNEWAFFEDTWRGNILIHNRKPERP
jgi:cephalosporin hydroxylase